MAKIKILVISVLLAIGVSGFAQPSDSSMNQLDTYKQAINDYNNGLNALEEKSAVITAKLAEQVYGQFVVGMSMLEEIINNESMKPEHQAKAIGILLDKMINTTFKMMRHSYDEKNPDGRVSLAMKPVRIGQEIGRDVLSVVVPLRVSGGQWYWKPAEAARREKLMRSLLTLMEEKLGEKMPVINQKAEVVQEYFYGQLHYMTDRAVNMRMERDSAQYWSRMLYFMAGLALFANPPIDYVAQPNYYSTFNAGMTNFMVMSFFWFMKGLSSTRKSTKMWVEFLDQIVTAKSEEFTKKLRKMLTEDFPKEYAVPFIPKTLRMEMALRKAISSVWKTHSKETRGITLVPNSLVLQCKHL